MYGFYIDEDRRKARRAKWNTVRIISIGFFGVILLGSLLLWLPFSNHQPIRYIDALFTAVTCVCVTGLVTVVPAAIYSGRKSDSAYSDPDRRTWNHCMYNCIFNSGWKKNKYEGTSCHSRSLWSVHTSRNDPVY